MEKIIYDNGEAILVKVKDVKEVFETLLNEMVVREEINEPETLEYIKGCVDDNIKAVEQMNAENIVCFKDCPMAGFYQIGTEVDTKELIDEKEGNETANEINNIITELVEQYINSELEAFVEWKKDINFSRIIYYDDAIKKIKEEFINTYDFSDTINKTIYQDIKEINKLIRRKLIAIDRSDIINLVMKDIMVINI